jgi:eukaryotic-like serine/threonine-protein kinase
MRECTVCQSCFPDTIHICDREGAPTKLTLSIEPVINERYHLKERIGTGSISVVYLAQEELLGTYHALKIILPEFIGHSTSLAKRFLLEARTAFAVRHPNILNVTDTGVVNELMPFLVMDFISGKSLQEVLSSRGPLSPSEAFEYLTVIGSGLSVAHAGGIVHGDLKPRNILIEDKRSLGEALRITDFGLSGVKSGKIDGPREGKWNGVLRSPLYLAPEEWSEEESDARSDIYSVGIILYQMLAGKVPFKGKSIAATMKAHLIEPPPPFTTNEIPAAVESVVRRALEKEAENRPQTIEDFVSEFQRALTNELPDDELLDFEQTIVLSHFPGFNSDLPKRVEEPEQYDFERTILPGSVKYDFEESVESEGDASDQANVTNDGFQIVPQSIQPVLLALGVVLVIVLIGVGVYYSRATQ